MAIILKKGSTTPSIAPLFTSPLQELRLVVGLGNPDKKYTQTRHNIGFMCLDKMREVYDEGRWSPTPKLKSQLASLNLGNIRVYLAKPTTYVNLSGEAVNAVLRFYKLTPSDVCLVYDEIRLPFGTLEVLQTDKDYGHNGLKSIQAHLGQSLQLIRVGIGPKRPSDIELSDFVLSDFTDQESQKLPKITREVCSLLGEMCNASFNYQLKRKLF